MLECTEINHSVRSQHCWLVGTYLLHLLFCRAMSSARWRRCCVSVTSVVVVSVPLWVKSEQNNDAPVEMLSYRYITWAQSTVCLVFSWTFTILPADTQISNKGKLSRKCNVPMAIARTLRWKHSLSVAKPHVIRFVSLFYSTKESRLAVPVYFLLFYYFFKYAPLKDLKKLVGT